MIAIFLFQLQGPVYEIDRGEARFYRFFTDIDSFLIAKFYVVDDSIKVKFFYTNKNDIFDSTSQGLIKNRKKKIKILIDALQAH